MKKNELIYRILDSAEKNGIVIALYDEFGKSVRVSVQLNTSACNTNIDDVEFSARASNALKRSGIFTIGEIVDQISKDGLLKIRNLGKKTQNEIKTRILVYGYKQLNDDEKIRFMSDVVEKNSVITEQ